MISLNAVNNSTTSKHDNEYMNLIESYDIDFDINGPSNLTETATHLP